MATGALASYNTLLKRGNAATPEVFTGVAECGDISGPTLKSNMEDVTNHNTGDGFEEFVPTTQSFGEIKFPCNFIPSNATQSYAAGFTLDWKNRTKRNWTMTFPDGTVWPFAGYVSEIAMKATVKGVLSADVTITLTGTNTLA
jgi:hypothetical protein